MINKEQKHRQNSFPVFALCGVGAGLFAWQLFHVVTTQYVIEHKKIPAEFDGFRIVQVSDLHNNHLICREGKLAARISALRPDIIVITGDLVDKTRVNYDMVLHLVRSLSSIADIYYVPGNHEASLNNRNILFRKLKLAGAKMLFDRREPIIRGSESITISGVIDPRFDIFRSDKVSDRMRMMMHFRDMEPVDPRFFNMLLVHRPENLTLYTDNRFDLVFAGHAHGGQWRIPPLGGIYVPNQGFFPEYSAGIYELCDTRMIVSRGLGNSLLPLRINNPFELIITTLKSEAI